MVILASSRLNANAGNDGLFHVLVFLECDERAHVGGLDVRERRQHPQLHLVLAREFHRADLQHLGTQGRELEHFLERHRRQAPRLGHDPRIGRVHAVHVRVDLALVGLERRRQRDARGIGAAAPERGDVVVVVDALEAGDDDHVSIHQVAADAFLLDGEDACLGERGVGDDRNLPAGIAPRLEPDSLQGERQQPDRHLLAGRGNDVELARAGIGVQLPREPEQAVGLARHRGGHDHQLVALGGEAGHTARDLADSLDAAHGGSAVLLDDQRHGVAFSAAGKKRLF
jgi:hypothetical protein